MTAWIRALEIKQTSLIADGKKRDTVKVNDVIILEVIFMDFFYFYLQQICTYFCDLPPTCLNTDFEIWAHGYELNKRWRCALCAVSCVILKVFTCCAFLLPLLIVLLCCDLSHFLLFRSIFNLSRSHVVSVLNFLVTHYSLSVWKCNLCLCHCDLHLHIVHKYTIIAT